MKSKTESEKITDLISKKFFLNQFVFNDLYANKDSQEYEFCDCLIEFYNYYIVIQIKEREENIENNTYNWYKNKVLRKAKKQIRDTYNYYYDSSYNIFSKEKSFEIDRNKELIPVIVFLNDEISYYEKNVISKTLNTVINVFNYNDFKVMLETLILPSDIISYMSNRRLLENSNERKIFFDETYPNLAIIGMPENEKEYAELFLSRTYFHDIVKYNLNEDYILFYNQVVSELNECINKSRNEFIKGLMCVSYVDAYKISKNWVKLIELIKEEKFVDPYRVIMDKRVYVFFNKTN